MKKSKKPKDFIQTPQYPGGKVALDKYIKDHLVHPQSAIDNNIEGDVTAEYFVDGMGKILEINILKSLFPACDQEVIRLIKSLKYNKAVTRGMKTKTRQTLKVHFNTPKPQPIRIKYTITPSEKKKNVASSKIGYTITIKNKL